MNSQTIKIICWYGDIRIRERGNEKDRKLHVTI
jgi:hypothetical protein